MKEPFMVMSTTANFLIERDADYFISSRERILGICVKSMFPEEEREILEAR